MKETLTRRIRVYGIVQGVGFRPTVSRHATTCNIHGSVSNKGPYVEIFAQAPEAQVDRFVTMIREQSPKRAAILKMNIEDVENPEIYKKYREFLTAISIKIFRLLRAKRRKGKSLSLQILQSAKSARKRCISRGTDGICIHLLTVHAADRD